LYGFDRNDPVYTAPIGECLMGSSRFTDPGTEAVISGDRDWFRKGSTAAQVNEEQRRSENI